MTKVLSTESGQHSADWLTAATQGSGKTGATLAQKTLEQENPRRETRNRKDHVGPSEEVFWGPRPVGEAVALSGPQLHPPPGAVQDQLPQAPPPEHLSRLEEAGQEDPSSWGFQDRDRTADDWSACLQQQSEGII